MLPPPPERRPRRSMRFPGCGLAALSSACCSTPIFGICTRSRTAAHTDSPSVKHGGDFLLQDWLRQRVLGCAHVTSSSRTRVPSPSPRGGGLCSRSRHSRPRAPAGARSCHHQPLPQPSRWGAQSAGARSCHHRPLPQSLRTGGLSSRTCDARILGCAHDTSRFKTRVLFPSPPRGGWGLGCRTRVLSRGFRGGVARACALFWVGVRLQASIPGGVARPGDSSQWPVRQTTNLRYHVVGLTPGNGERQHGCSQRQRSRH